MTLGLWLFLTLIWPALAPAITQALVPIDDQATLIITAQMLERLSPSTLYGGVVLVLLMCTLGPIYLSQLQAR